MTWLTKLAAAWVAGSIVALGACGGTAVIDAGSGAGSGGGGTSSGNAQGGGDPVCVTATPTGSLLECGGSGSVSSSGGSQCTSMLCDEAGNTWEFTCTDDSCSCNFNFGQKICNCVVEGGGQICSGNTPSCCPSPFPQ